MHAHNGCTVVCVCVHLCHGMRGSWLGIQACSLFGPLPPARVHAKYGICFLLQQSCESRAAQSGAAVAVAGPLRDYPWVPCATPIYTVHRSTTCTFGHICALWFGPLGLAAPGKVAANGVDRLTLAGAVAHELHNADSGCAIPNERDNGHGITGLHH